MSQTQPFFLFAATVVSRCFEFRSISAVSVDPTQRLANLAISQLILFSELCKI